MANTYLKEMTRKREKREKVSQVSQVSHCLTVS